MKSGMEKLHSLLFEEGRGLENIKFFPGTDRGLTPDQMCEAAQAAIHAALARGPHDNPPTSGRKKTSLASMISDM